MYEMYENIKCKFFFYSVVFLIIANKCLRKLLFLDLLKPICKTHLQLHSRVYIYAAYTDIPTYKNSFQGGISQ